MPSISGSPFAVLAQTPPLPLVGDTFFRKKSPQNTESSSNPTPFAYWWHLLLAALYCTSCESKVTAVQPKGMSQITSVDMIERYCFRFNIKISTISFTIFSLSYIFSYCISFYPLKTDLQNNVHESCTKVWIKIRVWNFRHLKISKASSDWQK